MRFNSIRIREEQKEKRQQEILRAGLYLFICKGYATTKVSDIAISVGMSTGVLFHYLESKEKLHETLAQLGVSSPMGIMPSAEAEPPCLL